MLQSDPHDFTILQMGPNRWPPVDAGPFDTIPWLRRLICELRERQSRPSEAFGRRYQLDLITDGYFEVPSIWNDRTLRSAGAIVLNDKTVFYAFEGEPDLLLGASSLGEGFPICAIVIPSKKLMINIGDEIWGPQISHLCSLYRVAREKGLTVLSLQGRPRSVTVLTGHPSFAHHAWNQLVALEKLAETGSLASTRLDIVVTHQPLGTIRELFPDRPLWSVTHHPESLLEQLNSVGRTFVPLGGFIVSRSLRKRLQRYASRRAKLTSVEKVRRKLLSRHRPVFWLSIRSRDRTATNQVEVLSTLCAAILGSYPNCGIILDGHSIPEDSSDYWDPAYLLTAIEADRRCAREVLAKLESRNVIGPGQCLYEAIGLSILQSIALAAAADLYFCHHGTVQHKIGWFTDVPGIVHCNRKTLELRPAAAVASQVEDGVTPIYIPDELVEDIPYDEQRGSAYEALKLQNYKVKDVDCLVEFFLEQGARILNTERRGHRKLKGWVARIRAAF